MFYKLLLVCGCIIALIIPASRCVIFNLHNIGIYSFYDIFQYFYKRQWRVFNEYGIDCFIL